MSTKIYWRVTYGPYNHAFVFDDKGEALDEIQTLRSEGTKCKLEEVEMEELDFESMPEFEGY